MGLALMGMVYFQAVTGRVHCPLEPRASFAELKISFLEGLPAFLAPVMLVGGLILGVATPTELGALTVVYAIALGFWYRELTWRQVFDAASETAVFCGVLVFIIAVAVPFGWLISFTRLPAELASAVLSFTKEPVIVLAVILKDIAQVTFAELVRAVLPFYIPLGILLLIVTYSPGFVLLVPSMFKG